MPGKKWVISLGGSVIIPSSDQIDLSFIREFRKLIEARVIRGEQFVICCGGGNTCRKYNRAALELAKPSASELDWLGIRATWLNAHLMKIVFGSNAPQEIITNPEEIQLNTPIAVAAGWKPGRSTDFMAVRLAIQIKAGSIINITNTPYVYDKDPKRHRDAKPIRAMTWNEFIGIVGEKWEPGMNMPFDPVASRLARQHGLRVIIASSNIRNLKGILEGKEFKGTRISD
ncbi:UMP kinase [Candidatus Woesearchaeota archaeon CG10_big_fil_rev_8_21_14_0_10_47_5]|nr:MAG: UMP kinase [Candidatus Woesearchaeota archaeon CG10_big_fil_rev_8_21_14_0_10_47_5]HII30216.1 UMP kinase [Candidatus Woesearchaeota archaeon]